MLSETLVYDLGCLLFHASPSKSISYTQTLVHSYLIKASNERLEAAMFLKYTQSMGRKGRVADVG